LKPSIEHIIKDIFKEPIISQKPLNSFLLHIKTISNELIIKNSPYSKIEVMMLDDLKAYIPTAKVYFYNDELIIMEYINDRCNFKQKDFAHLLAKMHSNKQEQFGYKYDTTIGPYHQPNTLKNTWLEFFRDQRLLYMAEQTYKEGKLPSNTLDKIQKLSTKLENYIDEPNHPSFLHGDIWSGNVMCKNNLPILIDPAIYNGHYEMELAFINLFNTFGDEFFDAYNSYKKIDSEFFNSKQHIYNLYPLLVHIRSFGNSYLNALENILKKFI